MQPDNKAKPVTDIGLRQSLIKAGEDIIEEKGLNALTLRGVARASGVSHMAPYSHFDDKDALLATIAEKGFENLTMDMRKATENQHDPQEKLLQVGIAYASYACQKPGLFRLMFTAGIRDRGRFETLTAAGQRAFSVCYSTVAEYNAPEDLTDEVLHLRALAMWSLVHGLSSLLIDDYIEAPDKSAAAIAPLVRAILSQARI